MTIPRLRKLAPDDTDLSVSLPPEILAEASRRLGWLGLMYAGAYTLAHYGQWLALVLTGRPSQAVMAQHVFSTGAIGMGIAVFALSRTNLLQPARLLDLGLVFNVAGAFGIAINEFWRGFYVGPRPFTGIPWEAAWILLFPLIAPHGPRKVLFASLLAATMGPAAVWLSGRLAGTSYFGPPVESFTYFLFTSYLCAALAWVVARIVLRYGVQLRAAREIGSYELVQKLEEGGMGEIWMARHRLLARPAAIKVIRADLLGANERSRDALIRRFEREARDTATLESPHTVSVYDFGVADDGSFYYVMELLNGESLDTHVKRLGPVTPARAVYLLRQMCQSLGEAHARGLIHRDIKPANIFVCRIGPEYDFVKVLDFGLVKHVEAQSPGSLLSVEGATAGTPAYMPPEMALDSQTVDARTDIYALGCVGYWLLTGHQVFTGETSVATILAHIRDTPVPLNERAPLEIPAALESLILACLAKSPADRPASVEELSDRLGASLAGEPWSPRLAERWWRDHGGIPPRIAATAEQTPRPLVPERIGIRGAAR